MPSSEFLMTSLIPIMSAITHTSSKSITLGSLVPCRIVLSHMCRVEALNSAVTLNPVIELPCPAFIFPSSVSNFSLSVSTSSIEAALLA